MNATLHQIGILKHQGKGRKEIGCLKCDFILGLDCFIVDCKRVKLMYYVDPLSGPRKMPSIDNILANKRYIDETAMFAVDTSEQSVSVKSDSHNIDVGSQLVYLVC